MPTLWETQISRVPARIVHEGHCWGSTSPGANAGVGGIQRSPDGSKALLEGDSQGSDPGKQLHFQASGLSFQNMGWRGEKEVAEKEQG